MRISDVCGLITKDPKAHGVHDAPYETTRTVFCTVGSVSRSEYYAANNLGLRPSYVLRLAAAAEYADETEVLFRNQRYRVIRTYVTADGAIELTVEREDVNGDD